MDDAYKAMVRKALEAPDHRLGTYRADHDMSACFPILTVRPMADKFLQSAVELEAMLKGITCKGWLTERGCHYYDGTANPVEVEKAVTAAKSGNETDEQLEALYAQYRDSIVDLGPVEGWQWRRFGQDYRWNSGEVLPDNGDSFDQIGRLTDSLPYEDLFKFKVVSSWYPQHLSYQAREPLVVSWSVSKARDNRLGMNVYTNSVEIYEDIPRVGMTYGLLLLVLCDLYGYGAGTLSIVSPEAHIDPQHVEAAGFEALETSLHPPSIRLSLEHEELWMFEHTNAYLDNYLVT